MKRETALPKYRNVTFDPATQYIEGEQLMPGLPAEMTSMTVTENGKTTTHELGPDAHEPSYMKFSADLSLAWIAEVYYSNLPGAAERIYAESDGYGERGYIPPQGYDWSGIRDSSPEAIERMLKIAQQYLSLTELEAIYGTQFGLPSLSQ